MTRAHHNARHALVLTFAIATGWLVFGCELPEADINCKGSTRCVINDSPGRDISNLGICVVSCGDDEDSNMCCPDDAEDEPVGTGSCTNVDTDPRHCGGCNISCGDGDCVAGLCECREDQVVCPGGCFDLQTSANNCGGCGIACMEGFPCVDGACRCPTGDEILCNGVCISASDPNNCGGCGITCSFGQTCSDGACVCDDGVSTVCNTECVDVTTDSRHCGVCNNPCDPGQTCADGVCGCGDNRDICPALPGVCTSLTTTDNCGGCGVICNPGELCLNDDLGGQYSCVCPTTSALCDGMCVDVQSDPQRCGDCETVCDPGLTCRVGECACSNAALTFCEPTGCVDTATNSVHCGVCDNVCTPPATCSASECTCPTGLYCDDMCRDTETDPMYCGSCTIACNPGSLCIDGQCTCGLVSITPGTGQVVPRSSPESVLTMSCDVQAASVNAASVAAFARSDGAIPTGAALSSSDTIAISPGATRAGDRVDLTLRSSVLDTGNNNIIGVVWQVFGNTRSSGGTFDAGTAFGVANEVIIDSADFDGSTLDLLVYDGTSVTPYYQDTGGAFVDSGLDIPTTSGVVEAGDVDADGDTDLLVQDGPFVLWTNNGTGTLSQTPRVVGAVDSLSLRLGDLDADGDLDAVVGGQELTVWRNDGAGLFVDTGQDLAVGTTISRAELADLDGDGDLDVYAPSVNRADEVWLNDGSGMFTQLIQDTSLSSANNHWASLRDLDGNGSIDAFVMGSTGALVYLNDGSGQFTSTATTIGGNSTCTPALGDVDGDDDIDVVVGDQLWLNAGNGSFAVTAADLGTGTCLRSVLADLDDDGILDVANTTDSGGLVRTLYIGQP